MLVSLAYVSVTYVKTNNHNQYHRSKMVQLNYLVQIRNLSGNDINVLKKQISGITALSNGYLVPAEEILKSKYIQDQNIELKDFYGYYLQTNTNGLIINANLHKP